MPRRCAKVPSHLVARLVGLVLSEVADAASDVDRAPITWPLPRWEGAIHDSCMYVLCSSQLLDISVNQLVPVLAFTPHQPPAFTSAEAPGQGVGSVLCRQVPADESSENAAGIVQARRSAALVCCTTAARSAYKRGRAALPWHCSSVLRCCPAFAACPTHTMLLPTQALVMSDVTINQSVIVKDIWVISVKASKVQNLCSPPGSSLGLAQPETVMLEVPKYVFTW